MTTTPFSDEVATLTRWAEGLDRDDQDRLLLALANLLGVEHIGPRTRDLFDRLLPILVEGADEATRRELARRLDAAPWTPEPLMAQLADGADEPLRMVLARLPSLTSSVAAALLSDNSPEVSLALAANSRASLDAEALDVLVEASRRSAALRVPLARRRDLTPAQAERLAGWSSPPVRRALTTRFGLDGAAPPSEPGLEGARRLVAKLGRSGRLTPGYALSALRQGRLEVFQEAVAALGGVPSEVLRSASRADDPAPLALACAAVGVDRAVFPEVLREVRAANGGHPAESPETVEAVMAALARPQADAAEALRARYARHTARWTAS